ncbi:MAG: RNA 2',3'-cyclic phosphodiesterase [Brevinematales bacterium]|nr:RNA 2',3'-cyclic phosphodiesterase [Brevinematales bacterium]
MRIFIGVNLPEELKDIVYQTIKFFKEKYNNAINYVPKENLHITLKFIGEINEKDFMSIKNSLEKVKFSPFKAELKGLGCFPDIFNERVLWIGVKDEDECFTKLYHNIISFLPEKFKKDDKTFSPHLTLARLKEKPLKSFISLIDKEKDFGDFTVSSFQLYESKLEREGARYTVLYSFPI